ncbi:type II secretion system minor pseudopilin GspK [Pseudomonas sp. R5(2019)]|uniref:type II secretion system minor pseudopilin GspK n=1 Tax=Pseudomonas sp. R5(2019) TaxID=2697566 RepID=UPI00141324F6|nr:type II secretion system minor pseudopilin GspK [Pseudomonas sp. R5(2019)]NBA96197.1 type II secretion system minor pseudopilin GspK [Pseudomonas sp. R5(2019)]
MTDRLRQRGVALISVLLITALATLIVSTLLSRQRLSLHISSHHIQHTQLWQLALSGEAWARQQLFSDLRSEDGMRRVHLGQRWAQPSPAFDIEGARIHIRLEDLGGRFNIDTLRHATDAITRARYQRLLLSLGVPAHDPLSLFQTARRPTPTLGDTTELRRLSVLDGLSLDRLQPWIATNGNQLLNINTASQRVLASLEGLDMVSAQAVIDERPASGYDSVQDFMQSPALEGREVNQRGLGVSSSRLRATVEVRAGDQSLRLVTDFQVHADGRLDTLRRRFAPAPPSHLAHLESP